MSTTFVCRGEILIALCLVLVIVWMNREAGLVEMALECPPLGIVLQVQMYIMFICTHVSPTKVYNPLFFSLHEHKSINSGQTFTFRVSCTTAVSAIEHSWGSVES